MLAGRGALCRRHLLSEKHGPHGRQHHHALHPLDAALRLCCVPQPVPQTAWSAMTAARRPGAANNNDIDLDMTMIVTTKGDVLKTMQACNRPRCNMKCATVVQRDVGDAKVWL